MSSPKRKLLPFVLLVAACHGSLGANLILRPFRPPIHWVPDVPFSSVAVRSSDITLRGRVFRTAVKRRGLAIFLHGHMNNQAQARHSLPTLLSLGYDVLTYDSRAHGASDGELCTYGYDEKRDLLRVITATGEREVVVIGFSLGAAVALQAAAIDPRIRRVVAISSFVDLRHAVEGRAAFLGRSFVERSLSEAAALGGLDVESVSPLRAAPKIKVPVLVVHGRDDRETPPWHSEQIFAALHGPKQHFVVDGAGHDSVSLARRAVGASSGIPRRVKRISGF